MARDTVNIRILDREYQVHCPPEERPALLRSAEALDARMREIRKAGHVLGLERIAVMAALNLTYDLLETERRVEENSALAAELARLDAKLGDALARLEVRDVAIRAPADEPPGV
ncbi:MAG: cell division protein ZapA [Porticoccaceae bacterium]|nr:MAG: cell division protein ZapA [Porticoccaceae bacterium]